MRDFAQVWADGLINSDIVIRGMNSLAIDSLGLDKLDRDILKTVIVNYSGGPVGSETLAISIGEAVDTLEDVYEPYLIQKGLIQRTPRGRTATHLAYQHLDMKQKEREDQQLLF
jgi:Holliday junction DNA helicase RuvB